MIGWLWRMIVGRFREPKLPDFPPLPPLQPIIKCYHIWKTIYSSNITNDKNMTGKVYHQECTKCGRLRQEIFSIL